MIPVAEERTPPADARSGLPSPRQAHSHSADLSASGPSSVARSDLVDECRELAKQAIALLLAFAAPWVHTIHQFALRIGDGIRSADKKVPRYLMVRGLGPEVG